jgi:hypothetical protein
LSMLSDSIRTPSKRTPKAIHTVEQLTRPEV